MLISSVTNVLAESHQTNTVTHSSQITYYFVQGCIVDNEYVDMILNPVMLEVSLRNVWSLDPDVLRDKTLSNK